MKLEINFKKKTGKFANMWKLNNMLLNIQWVKREIKYFETNENGNITYQNLWGTAKTVLRGKFTVINAYLKKQEKSQTT